MSNVKNYTEQGGEKTVIGGILDIASGGTLEIVSGGTLEIASGATLDIASGGKLTVAGTELKPAATQADSTAETVADLITDFNALLAKLQAAGLMESGDE